MKATLDSIAGDENRKREVIRGDAVDKAEQLSELEWCVCTCTCACACACMCVCCLAIQISYYLLAQVVL